MRFSRRLRPLVLVSLASLATSALLAGCPDLSSLLPLPPGDADAPEVAMGDERVVEPEPPDAEAGVAPDTGCPFTFCDDFDRDGSAQTGWSGSIVNGGRLDLVSDASVSPPQSLLASLTQNQPLYLRKALPTAATSVTIEFDIDITRLSDAGEVDLAQLRWTTLPAPCTGLGLYLVRGSDRNVVLQETYTDCGGLRDNLLEVPAGWHRFRLELDVGAPQAARVFLDGVRVTDIALRVAFPTSESELRVGVPAVSGAGVPLQVRFDNVIANVR